MLSVKGNPRSTPPLPRDPAHSTPTPPASLTFTRLGQEIGRGCRLWAGAEGFAVWEEVLGYAWDRELEGMGGVCVRAQALGGILGAGGGLWAGTE